VLLREHLLGQWEYVIHRVALPRGDGVDRPKLGLINLPLEAFQDDLALGV